MEIDAKTTGVNPFPSFHRTEKPSKKSDATSEVKARSEEAFEKQQAAKDTAVKNLENAIEEFERQREKIDAEKYLKEIINITQVFNKKLNFSIDKELDQVIVKVVDAQTDKVIKELPPEELRRLYSKMKEAMGLIIDKTI